jgi:LCP family protein required for cell wall assembly
VALSRGGLGCVVQTVENLTGISIPYAMEVTFSGVIHMTRAIGGVDVCVESPIRDADSHLYLEPGTHTIEGPTALAFLRTRKMVGDGSDLGRIGLQQSFLSSMIRKVTSGDTLTDMNKLYSIATVATQNLTLSRSLGGLDAMISLALIARDLDLSKVSFVTYPGSTGSLEHPGKVIPIKSQADDLFAKIKADVPIIPQSGNTGSGTNVVESGSSGQGNVGNSVRGQTADTVTCAVGR